MGERATAGSAGRVHLVDVVTGSATTLTPCDGGWKVREAGPLRLWERIERVLDAYDEADRPGPGTFTLHVYDSGQHLWHPQMPGVPLCHGCFDLSPGARAVPPVLSVPLYSATEIVLLPGAIRAT